jgi:hypothetical protein
MLLTLSEPLRIGLDTDVVDVCVKPGLEVLFPMLASLSSQGKFSILPISKVGWGAITGEFGGGDGLFFPVLDSTVMVPAAF